MQVALVTDTFPPDLNGVSLTMDRLRHGLESRGHRVSVVRPSGGLVPLRVRRRETGVRFEELLTTASSSPIDQSTPSSTHTPAP